MTIHTRLEACLEQLSFEETLIRLYGREGKDRARTRCLEAAKGFRQTFGYSAQALFSAPGRTELGGNHTDHQRGCVLAAAVDLDILAAATVTDSGVIRVLSQGYPMTEVSLRELTPQEGEKNTSAALIRGVASRMQELGCDLQGRGLDVYMTSTVPKGSGLSSSAAFEVLMGAMLNELLWERHCTPVELAQIGQYAENVFFGKPCGLMDQTASSVGGVVAIDFADTAHPIVERLDVDLHTCGYALCILDSGAGHEDLTGEYSAITEELRAVCRVFGKEVLREVPEADFLAELPHVRKAVGDRAVNRAFHVYGENRRVREEVQALRSGDFQRFLTLVRESGRSSAMYLQNIIPTSSTTAQELMVTIALCERMLEGRGAVRVHGGGFGGTAQAFVPLDMLDRFRDRVEASLGRGCCHVVRIRPAGGIRLG